jgi:hypothetical protein
MHTALLARSAVFVSGMTLMAQAAHAQTHPPVVQRELNRLLKDCRSSGGRPTVKAGAVTAASLRDGNYSDFIIWSGEIDCAGALTAFGGAAGQALVLIPGDGRGIRQVPAHSWKLVGSGQMSVEIIGGINCAKGHHDHCRNTLQWNGRALATAGSQAQTDAPISTGTNPRSIVGDWAETREGCASPMAGRTRIGAMSLANDEFSCRFTSITRAGATVTWNGTCEDGTGPRSGKQQKSTVTATESSARLTIRINGNAWAPMIRCPR